MESGKPASLSEKMEWALEAEQITFVLPAVGDFPRRPRAKTSQQWVLNYNVETQGITPVAPRERTDGQYSKIFTLWFTVNFNLSSFSAGVLGPVIYGLSTRDSCLVILFLNIVACIPPAYLSTWGPKLGMRQMIQARYSFGFFGVILPVFFNLVTLIGFCISGCILGGQTLSSVANGNLSWNVGIGIVAVISLLISFCGYKVLHWFERFAWIPTLVSLLVAIGLGAEHMKLSPVPPATSKQVLSFAAGIGGFTIAWSSMSSDFTCYLRQDAPTKRVFWYAYLGMFLSTASLQLMGAAAGASLANVQSWSDGYNSHSVGGLLEAILSPAGVLGKFLTVLLAFSVMGNIAATFYSITLNCQMILPVLIVVPRYVFSIVATAIVIPLSIIGAHRFAATLSDFLGIVGYWAIAFVAILIEDHFFFRGGNFENYDRASWNLRGELPIGFAASFAFASAFGLAIASMDQVWYVGPIAQRTGDIGLGIALIVTMIIYPPCRWVESRKGRTLISLAVFEKKTFRRR